MRQAICYMPAHSHQRTNHRRDTYSRICLAHRSVNVTQRAYSFLAPCNKPGRCRADLLVSLLRSSFLYLYSVIAIEIQFDPAVSGCAAWSVVRGLGTMRTGLTVAGPGLLKLRRAR